MDKPFGLVKMRCFRGIGSSCKQIFIRHRAGYTTCFRHATSQSPVSPFSGPRPIHQRKPTFLQSTNRTFGSTGSRATNGRGTSVLLGHSTSSPSDYVPILGTYKLCLYRRHLSTTSGKSGGPGKMDKKKIKDEQNLRKEFQAFSALLSRSGYNNQEQINRLCANSVHWFSTGKENHQQQRQPQENEEGKENDQPDNEDKMPFVARLMLFAWFGFLLYFMFRLQGNDEMGPYKFVSWNEFVHDMLSKGEVEEIIVRPELEIAFIKLYPGAIVKGHRVESDMLTMKILDAQRFEDRVRNTEAELGIKSGIPISYQRENSWTSLIYMAIIGAAIFLVFRNMVRIQIPNPTDMFASERKAKFIRVDQQTAQGKGISFKDVAGLHEAKVEVMEFVDYMKRPDKYKDLGGRVPRGTLLLGPPGCGKTLLAKAVATEAKVPFLAMAGSEFVEMLGGLGAARVRDLFKEARQNAPCIVYIDEIDAIGRKRTGNNWSQSTEEEHTLNQLLVEMDGMDTVEGVIMLASTNRSDILDKALLRPGRFDRHIMIDWPTLAERKEIFEMYLQQLKIAKPATEYSEKLAQLSPGMSGADIANICNEAALHAARDNHTRVGWPNFDYAVERVVAGVAKKSRVLSPQEKKIVAYHEAGHAVVGWLLQYTDPLLRVSIVPRTSNALGFAQYLPADLKLHSQQELIERMCMALGGRVAESLTFNAVTSGAQDDLQKVTKMAYTQIQALGMNEKIGHVSFPTREEKGGPRPFSKKLANLIDQEAQQMVAQCYQHTEALLHENKEKLRVVAEALLERECLTYDDMEELIGPPTYSKAKPPIGNKQANKPPPPPSVVLQ